MEVSRKNRSIAEMYGCNDRLKLEVCGSTSATYKSSMQIIKHSGIPCCLCRLHVDADIQRSK